MGRVRPAPSLKSLPLKELRSALRRGDATAKDLKRIQNELERRKVQRENRKKKLKNMPVTKLTKREIEALLAAGGLPPKRRKALELERNHRISGYYQRFAVIVSGGSPGLGRRK